jgi:hypothetical protein
MFERHHVVSTTSAFFRGADAPFDVRDVFVFPADIEFRVQVGPKNEGDVEASLAVDPMDPLYRLLETLFLPVVKDFACYETDVGRD